MRNVKLGALSQAIVALNLLVIPAVGAQAERPRQAREPVLRSDAGHALPTEESAVKDVQTYLGLRTGRWEVRKITNVASELSSIRGEQSFTMDAIVDVKVKAAITPGETELRNDPWLVRLAGKRGEKKSAHVKLTWVKRDMTWKLRNLE